MHASVMLFSNCQKWRNGLCYKISNLFPFPIVHTFIQSRYNNRLLKIAYVVTRAAANFVHSYSGWSKPWHWECQCALGGGGRCEWDEHSEHRWWKYLDDGVLQFWSVSVKLNVETRFNCTFVHVLPTRVEPLHGDIEHVIAAKAYSPPVQTYT